MTEQEKRTLAALARMAAQYLEREGELDSQSMSAGEDALRVLADYGFVVISAGGRFAAWTPAGREFLVAN